MEFKFKLFQDVVFKSNGRIGVVIKQNANGTYDLLCEQPFWHQEYGVKEDELVSRRADGKTIVDLIREVENGC